MALPQNPLIITNAQFRSKVVGLNDFEVNGLIVISEKRGGVNQQWSFEQISGDTYNIQSQVDIPSFINAADGISTPVPLNGNASPTTFKVRIIGTAGAIAVTISKDNLYWTVHNGNNRSQVVLEPGHGSASSASEAQKWILSTVEVPSEPS